MKRLELGDDGVAALVGLVLEDRDLGVSIELDVAVVRGGEAGHQDLQPGAVSGHPGAGEQLLPVQAVDAREQVGGALDERDQGAHGQRDAALGEVTADAVEGREQPELLVDEPREPLAGDLGALVGRGQRARGRTHPAGTASARVSTNDSPALVLLDDVELVFHELVDDVQSGGAAVGTGVGP